MDSKEIKEKYSWYNTPPEDRKKEQVDRIKKARSEGYIKHKTLHHLERSVDTLMQYVFLISKKRMQIKYVNENNKLLEKQYDPIPGFEVHEDLFRNYSCLSYGCSKCCTHHGYINILSSNQYFELKQKYQNTDKWVDYEKFTIEIDGKIYDFYKYEHLTNICHHLDTEINGCGVHDLNPLHCMFPLVKFTQKENGVTVLSKRYFGRNVIGIQCPVRFDDEVDLDRAYGTAKWMFSRLKELCDELEVDTYIDEILVAIDKKYKYIKDNLLIKNNVLF